MREERLSGRQLSVAMTVGGLSSAAAWAGTADWRWLLAAVPFGVGIGWLLLRRVGRRPLRPWLRGLYCAWGAVLAAQTLARAAERVRAAAGGAADTGWLLALTALPLLWMCWGRTGPFFRTAEILWLAALAASALILLLALPRLDWDWALAPAGGWYESLPAAAGVLSAGLFTLPHLYKLPPEEEKTGRGLVWLAALGALAAAFSLTAAGLLSPRTAARLEGPFFAAVGLLGDSARLEGLVSALWLLPDLALAGLLLRCWGERRWPALGAAVALGLALCGVMEAAHPAALALGSLALAVLTALTPPDEEKIVVGP